MMTRIRFALLAPAAFIGACYTSPPPEGFGQALQPNGVQGTLTVTGGKRVHGELLEVRDSAYVLLVDNRVAVVPYRAIQEAGFEHQDWACCSYANPSASVRERLRWSSRFPFGIRDEALAALLRASGQTRPDSVASP